MPLNWHRIFFGDQSSWLLAEIAFRTTFLFLFTLVMIRLVGKRFMGQLSPFELIIVVALGACLGGPMMQPNVPLINGMIVVTTLVFLHAFLGSLKSRFVTFDQFAESPARAVIAEGIINLATLRHEHVALDEVFMLLRQCGVQSLGQVKVAYLETSGRLSVFLYPPRDILPGLPLSPPPENYRQETVPKLADRYAMQACARCGTIQTQTPDTVVDRCKNCESRLLIPALDGRDLVDANQINQRFD